MSGDHVWDRHHHQLRNDGTAEMMIGWPATPAQLYITPYPACGLDARRLPLLLGRWFFFFLFFSYRRRTAGRINSPTASFLLPSCFPPPKQEEDAVMAVVGHGERLDVET